jgi:serine/threonine-protein kinase
VTLSAADGTVRWSQSYDRPITNVFAVQDEIAREVARELLGTLDVTPAGSLVRDETADPVAHSLLLQGIVLWNRRSEQFLRQAVGLFEQAVARDPAYARAEAWLALGNNTLAWYTDDETDPYLTRALDAADRALKMDSTLAEAHASAGAALWTMGRDRESADRFRRAIALDSTLAMSWGWSGMLSGRRDLAEALRRTRRAVDAEPASLISRTQVSQVLNVARRFPEADSVARSVLALDSSFGLAWLQRAEALAGMGRLAEAIEIMEKRVLTVAGVRRAELESIHAWLLAVAERDVDARAVLERLRVRSGGRLPPIAAAAAALESLGDREAAVALLAEAVARHDPWLWSSRGIRNDELRKDPRAAALFARLEAQ